MRVVLRTARTATSPSQQCGVRHIWKSERLSIRYFHVANDAGILSDEGIEEAILYNWIEALIEYNQETKEGVN